MHLHVMDNGHGHGSGYDATRLNGKLMSSGNGKSSSFSHFDIHGKSIVIVKFIMHQPQQRTANRCELVNKNRRVSQQCLGIAGWIMQNERHCHRLRVRQLYRWFPNCRDGPATDIQQTHRTSCNRLNTRIFCGILICDARGTTIALTVSLR